MWELLPLVLVSSFLGSAHCVGMCGPLALVVGSGCRTFGGNLRRQLAFSLGRMFTYVALGVFASVAAMYLSHRWRWFFWVPAAASLLAGGLLIWQSLGYLWRSSRPGAGGGLALLGGGLLGPLLRGSDARSGFLAGVFTGFLPCGLVYAYLALAAGTHQVLQAAAVMATFGLGTVPAMLASGCGLQLATWRWRHRLFQVAAVATLVVGVLAVARGVSGSLHPAQAQGCPLCPAGQEAPASE